VLLTSRADCRPSGTGAETPWLRRTLLPICAAALVNLVACTTQSGSMSLEGKPLSGYVEMSQVQAAYVGSGNAGNGTLRYRGVLSHSPSAGSALEGSASRRSRRRARSTDWSASATSRARTFRIAMACPGYYEHGRPVAEERKWCDHASSREAARADAESRWRRGRDPNEGVTSSARRRKIRLFVAEFTKKYPKLKQPKCLSDLDPMTAAVHLDKFGLPSIQST
jgi:hypothetical protein